MEVQKHLFVIERGVIKELLKLKNERLYYLHGNDHVRHVVDHRSVIFSSARILRGQSLTVSNYG